MANNKITDWEDVPVSEINDWEDIPTNNSSSLEASKQGLFSGLTLDFDDELGGALEAAGRTVGIKGLGAPSISETELTSPVGLDFDSLEKAYLEARDRRRNLKKESQEDNSGAFTAGQIGGSIASAFVPGLNVAKGVSFSGRLGNAAAQGAAVGLGTSEADNVEDLAMDSLQGAGMNVAFQGLGEKVISPALSKAGSVVSSGLNKITPYAKSGAVKTLTKTGNLLSGLDEDSAEFFLKNPRLSESMELDGAAYQLGKEVENSIYETKSELGENVNRATKEFLKNKKDEFLPGIKSQLKQSIDDFLEVNAPSRKGFSALTMKEQDTLSNLSNVIRGDDFTGDDLIKFRGLIDSGMKVAQKYDQEGVGPYMNYLKNLRHQADRFLDDVSPGIDSANSKYSQFMDDESLLRPFTRDGQVESAANNLFGANKKAQQEAASRILSKDQMERAQALMYNKASDAQGPAGSKYGLRNLLTAASFIPTFGVSTVLTDKNAWKAGLRTLGKMEDKISYVLKNNPEVLGKFSRPLQSAMDRGALSLSATHFLLQQQDPEYRKTIEDLDKE